MVTQLFVVVAVTTAAVVSVTVQGYVTSTATSSRTAFSTYRTGRSPPPPSSSSLASSYHHRIQCCQQHQRRISKKGEKWNLYSSQWDDEDDLDTASGKATTSYEDAGKVLQDEEAMEAVGGLGDYDTNPNYREDDTERLRAAIRERTEAMGIKKAAVDQEALKQAEERAKARMEALRAGESLDGTFGGIDLSQISQEAPRGSNADNLPSMFYEPELEMTKEEMAEADPVGQLPIYDQVVDTIKTATWPSITRVAKDVFILTASILLSALLLVGWDGLLRDAYTSLGLIPTPEQITRPTDNLVLPDGWTDNMSEEDLMKFQDDTSSSSSSSKAGKSTSSSSDQGFPDL